MSKLIAEKKLPSLNMLETILNSMDALLYVSDLQTNRVLFANDRIKRHFNLDGQVVGQICWNVFQRGFEKRCTYCPISRLMEDADDPIVWEARNTLTNRFYRNTSRIIEWANGKMVHLMHSTDITDIRLTEASLEKRLREQELISTISQSFTTARDTHLLIRDALKMAGKFFCANQAFLSKYQKNDGYLECLAEWCDAEGQPYIGKEDKWPITRDMKIYTDLTINGYVAINDFFMLTHPNFQKVKDYDLRAFLNISLEVSGEFWGIIGFIINKRTYNWSESDIHLGKLLAGVFSGIISRSITEEKLLNMKEMAEQASHAKGEFLSHMSHEMRTPMNAIIGMAGIAKKSGDPQKMGYCLEQIDNASRHLLGLINDILDISKIEANKLTLASSEFELEKMLVNITSVLNFQIEEKKQTLIINIDKDVAPAFIGDEMRLSQVIANLLSNAVKFTPVGGVITLDIYTVNVANGVSTLFFRVTDNGIGIAKEQQTQLFSPFEQADSGISRKYGGTGLGLTISKAIVELMEGRIWIESELGQGSKFSFIIKMNNYEGPLYKKTAVSLDKAAIHVLAVEETPEVMDYLTRVMSELGVRCNVVGSGSTALERIRQSSNDPYNTFFIDWKTSDIDVIELIKEIKRTNRDNKVNVLISQADWSSIEQDASMSCVDRFIFKPLFASTLMNAIHESTSILSTAKQPENNACEYNFMGHTLLVADDIDINREIIAEILDDTQVALDFAHNGAQALSMFEKNADRYSLVLMDIQMPKMNGYEAAQAIRALDRDKAGSTPIIAMTANVFREDIEKCMQVGMNDHIGKPIITEELMQKLNKHLRPARAN